MRPGISMLRFVLCALAFVCLAEGSSVAKQMAVIVNRENSTQELTVAELTKIFKCDTQKWSGGRTITVVLRDPATPEMELLLSRVYKTTPEELRSFIAQHPGSVIMVDSNEAMLKTIAATPGAIGLIDVFRITQEVKVVKIDGKLPVEYGYLLRGN